MSNGTADSASKCEARVKVNAGELLGSQLGLGGLLQRVELHAARR